MADAGVYAAIVKETLATSFSALNRATSTNAPSSQLMRKLLVVKELLVARMKNGFVFESQDKTASNFDLASNTSAA